MFSFFWYSVLCAFLPPLAVLLTGRMGSFVLSDHKNEQRFERLKNELNR